MTVNANSVLRLIAVVCFALATFGVNPGGVAMVPLGLALWCGSTFA